ncbi:MAG: UDP-N-acetylglucosamine 1-carboxyvinyltransferase [Candidatus Nealsonbacteria bacterium]|nr:UDP-N-acetylglucosamine 1-carboxyvinyltransferase [Candidatus Nealsonbacteria bacterium]
MSEKFIIHGGKPLKGEIEVRGAKNAAFPILTASLLTKEECEISNLPLIEDVFRMIEILKGMGSEISWIGERTIRIKNSNINPLKIREDLVCLLRGSILFFGPLLARFGKIKFPKPGGCIIGARPITTHLDGFRQLGIKVKKKGKNYLMQCSGHESGKVILNEFSVTATENLMLFASLMPNKIVLKGADGDYQVQELAKFLKKMGVKIKGEGTHEIIIIGSKKLKGVKHKLVNDPIEAGTFILTAACTKGDVLVKNAEVRFLELPLKKLKDFGIPYKIIGNSVRVLPWKKLIIDKIQSLPYPGIPSDLQSAFGVLSTQAEGSTLIHDPLYEGRLKYLEELNKMGAEIYFADPHRAIVNGPTKLYGRELNSFDLRGGAALIIAGLCAKGKTVINNIYQVDRGYEKIEERLQKLGADIKRVKD